MYAKHKITTHQVQIAIMDGKGAWLVLRALVKIMDGKAAWQEILIQDYSVIHSRITFWSGCGLKFESEDVLRSVFKQSTPDRNYGW